jgi:tetratricopeptide (TPR) repeat protein
MFDKFDIRQKHSILVVLMLIILTLGVYWPVQDYEFLNYDDNLYVTDNYLTQSGLTYQWIVKTFKDTHIGHWHPLTLMSHMLDWQLYRENSRGHHWTSVIIHIFNTVLLFFFFRNITGAIWRSAFVATLFAIHPINVESVAWVAERKNVLSTFFWIVTMLFYVRYVKQPNWKRYLPVFFSFALGLMSKPMLVTLPFVLLLLDYWPLSRTTIITRNENQTETSKLNIKRHEISFLILEKVPLFLLTSVSIVLTIYSARSVDTVASLESLPLFKRIGNAIVFYGYYIKKMFWPADLAVFYPHWNIPIWQILFAAILLVLITLIVCKYFLRYPYLAVGWFWYLGTLVPVIGIVQAGSQAMADRYAYVPFIGLFVMIVWGMGYALKKKYLAKVTAIISLVVITVLMIFTHYQIKYWENTFTLFNHALNVTDNNYVAHYMIAQELLHKNRIDEAISHYQIAILFDTQKFLPLEGIGRAYRIKGDTDKAIEAFRLAITINPKLTAAYDNLCKVLWQLGRREEALTEYRKAVAQINDNPYLYYNFGNVLAVQGYYDEAVIQFNQVLRIRPQDAIAHNRLALVLLRQGKINDALNHFREAVKFQPQNANAHYQLALILKQKGLTEEANQHYQEAIRINPEFKNRK